VNFSTSDGTALAGKNYAAATGTLTFATGQSSASFDITLSRDYQATPTLDFQIALTDPTGGASLGGTATATVRLLDVDGESQVQFGSPTFTTTESGGAASVTVTRTGTGLGRAISVDYATSNGTATSGTDYIPASGTLSFASGQESATFEVPILDRGLTSGSTTVNLALSAPSDGAALGNPASALLTIQDVEQSGALQFNAAAVNIADGSSVATLTVTRGDGADGLVTIHYATADGSAKAGSQYVGSSGILTFAPGETTHTLTVALLQATGGLTFRLLLSAPTGGASLGTPANAVLTLGSQGGSGSSLPSQVQFSVATIHVARSAGAATVTVMRTGGVSNAVTVNYGTVAGTALAGVDYTTTTGTLTFAPGITAQTLVVPIINSASQGSRTLSIVLSQPSGGATLHAPTTLQLSIDNPLPVEPIPANIGSVAGIFTHSSEAFSGFVTGAYALYLKRLPDPDGLDYWVNQLQFNGLTDEKLETGFLSSDEYIANHGGAGSGWVIGMYQDLLGRNPDPSGLAYWTGVLGSGGNPYAVALGFAASAEREAQRIAGDYQVYLGRQLDSAGQAYWVSQFLAGARNEDVVAGFISSPEYYENVNKGKSNHSAWLESVFQDVLHRDPTADDLAYWLTQLF
jgi:hypothetical protein